MKTKSDKEILISMGYRQMGKNIYGKPIAHHMFIYDYPNSTLKNIFKGRDNNLHIWDSQGYELTPDVEDDFLKFIKYCEQFTRISTDCASNFEFINNDDIALLMYDKL